MSAARRLLAAATGPLAFLDLYGEPAFVAPQVLPSAAAEAFQP